MAQSLLVGPAALMWRCRAPLILCNLRPSSLLQVCPRGRTALHYAVCDGRVELVEALLSAGADVEAEAGPARLTPLFLAVQFEQVGAARALVRWGAQVGVEREGGTPLHKAALHGYVELIEALVEGGADVNVRANDATPLHDAVIAEQCDAARALVEAGADLEATLGEDGSTALHCAASDGPAALVGTLVQMRADVNAHDRRGLTPLHCAARENNVAAMRVLLDAGADINACDAGGILRDIPGRACAITPLWLAAVRCQMAAIKLLVDRGADVSMCCAGPMALSCAAEHGQIELIEELLDKGADDGRPWAPVWA
eukprot:scaffold326146_cov73-Tisochrysis_lutea.AAC.1